MAPRMQSSPPSPTESTFTIPGQIPAKQPSRWSWEAIRSQPFTRAIAEAAGIAAVALAGSAIVLWVLWPPIPADERANVKIPRSFEDLKALNEVLDSVVKTAGLRTLACFIIVYLNLQAWTLPGSMYLSILGGAMYGLWALPLVCLCIASGATLAYALSARFGPALLLSSAKWRARIEAWSEKLAAQTSLTEYLVLLRIAPLPPHWVINYMSPLVKIPVGTHFVSTFFGVAGASFIHVQIGTTLDSMTSSADFHNCLMFAGIVVAILIPIGLRKYASKKIGDTDIEPGQIRLGADEPALPLARGDTRLVFVDDSGREQVRLSPTFIARPSNGR